MNLTIMIVIGAILFGLLIAFIVINRNQRKQPNYRAFFIIGVTWLPLGFATRNYVFSVVGACFLAVALANRKKWKDEPKWADLSPQARKLKLFVVISLAVLLLVGIAVYILTRQGIIQI